MESLLPGAIATSDATIIAGLKNREPAAMATLYDKYGRMVYSVAVRILGHTGEAEETTQEVFFRVWTRADLIDISRGSLAPWLASVARNLAIDSLRAARGRERRKEHSLSGNVAAPVEIHVSSSIDYRRAFKNLSHEQRQAIELAYFEGLSQTEISERMERPLGTVKTWVRSALSVLRETLSDRSLPISEPALTATGNNIRFKEVRDNRTTASFENG